MASPGVKTDPRFTSGRIPAAADVPAFLRWAVAMRPFPGQTSCGDAFAVVDTASGAVLAVIDGLGHGPEAAAAAQAAAAAIRTNALAPVEVLLERCHGAMAGSRGAVATVAQIARHSGLMRWAGIGNVEGVVARRSAGGSRIAYAPLRGGILGSVFEGARAGQLDLAPGELLALATDGLQGSFVDRLRPGAEPAEMAGELLAAFSRPDDDALVLVARFEGAAP